MRILSFISSIGNLDQLAAPQVDPEPGKDVDVVAVDEHLLPLGAKELQHLRELGGRGFGQEEGSGGGGGGEQRPGWREIKYQWKKKLASMVS